LDTAQLYFIKKKKGRGPKAINAEQKGKSRRRVWPGRTPKRIIF